MRGILINKTVHTGNNLGLVMTAKDLPAPTPQTYTVNVPGRNGLIDMSEFLTGEPTYDNRTLNFKFVGDGSRETVLSLIDTMLAYHGRKITVTTDDYPDWYYEGRATVKYTDKGHYVEFELTVDAYPFRIKKDSIIVQKYPNPEKDVVLTNTGAHRVPVKVTSISNATIAIGTITYNISAGTYTELFYIPAGGITIHISGFGQLTFEYREERI
jgi:hypothetical protein